MERLKTTALFTSVLSALVLFIAISCGSPKTEIDKQAYAHTVTHPYNIELHTGITFTKNICTRMNDKGEDFLDMPYSTLYNYWNQEVAREVKSFSRILTPDSLNNNQLKEHMLSIDGIIVDLPEEWMEISRDKYVKESLKGYISGDTLYLEFNH